MIRISFTNKFLRDKFPVQFYLFENVFGKNDVEFELTPFSHIALLKCGIGEMLVESFLLPPLDARNVEATNVNICNLILRDANFSRSYFSGSNFKNSDMRRANLRYSEFQNTNFSEVDLRNADLSHSDFNGADFSDSDLRGADLSRSTFVGAKFNRTRLDYTNLTLSSFKGANFEYAEFLGADMSSSDFHLANLNNACKGRITSIDHYLPDGWTLSERNCFQRKSKRYYT